LLGRCVCETIARIGPDPVEEIDLRGFVPLLSGIVAGVALVGADVARSAGPTCGDVVTTDVVLTESLTGCATGLVIGADGITVDLAGHAIEGLGTSAGAGIEASERTGVVVRNGVIRGFAAGVRLIATSDSTIADLEIRETESGVVLLGDGSHANDVQGNTITDSAFGIQIVLSTSDRVVRNRIIGVSDTGLSCSGGGELHLAQNDFVGNGLGVELFACSATVVSNIATANAGAGIFSNASAVRVEKNLASGNGTGIVIGFGSDAAMVGNVATENAGTGILRVRTNGLVEKNRANGNGGSGIVADDSHGLFLGNVTNANGGSGLAIVDSIPTHGPLHMVADHLANANAQYGVFTTLEGVVDGGNNRARANGPPQSRGRAGGGSIQCVGVPCR
jgi:hypothetical protein